MGIRNRKAYKRELWERQGGACALCGEGMEWKHANLDHKVPKRRRGQDSIGNLRLTHAWCNNNRCNITEGN